MAHEEEEVALWLEEKITPYDKILHGATKVYHIEKTKFQMMHVIENGAHGKALILDGMWQSCQDDEFLYHEPLVQVPCICHGNPKSVLVLGGGEGATVREALRWKSVESVVMVDIDGPVVDACKRYMPEFSQGAFEDPRTTVIIDDAFNFLQVDERKWDVIIYDLSDPIENGPAFQLFTKEVFAKVKRALAPGGYFVVQAGAISPVEGYLYVRLHSTLRSVFQHVQPYASMIPTFSSLWGFLLCTDVGPVNPMPDVAATNALLAERTTGGFRMLDGISFLGLFQLPLNVRRAIAAETEVYTVEHPPAMYGQGVFETTQQHEQLRQGS